MTTALQRPGGDGPASLPGAPPPGPLPSGQPARGRVRGFLREPAWPLVALLAGWPVWWFLGLGDYIPMLLAIPMLRRMYVWRARRLRVIRKPPAFLAWVLFLLVMVSGVATLSLTPPQTLPGPVSHKLASWALRALSYGAATVILLYAGNLTEKELPRRRLAWLLGLLAIYTVGGGLVGVADPSLHFTSPLAYVVPHSIQNADVAIASALHPAVTQHQSFQGSGRIAAPFSYSNGWGDNLAILIPWLVVAWRVYGSRRQRKIAMAVLAVAIVPIILSYDRGLWIGLALAALYVFGRLTTQANLNRLLILMGSLVMVIVVIVATPLLGVIGTRFSHASSNAGRASQIVIATQGALISPIIGYGDTRHQIGGSKSITIGRTAGCSDCGQQDIGSHGQLWLLLFANGFVGAACYLTFFGYGVWRFRRDKSPYGLAGELILLLEFVFMFVYLTVGITLVFTFLAYSLLWRNDMRRRDELAAAGTDGPPAAAGNAERGITAGAPA